MARILVIDDEELVRFSLRTALETEGYDVIEAENGKAAARPLDEYQFDLVITDIVMPEKEGIETIIDLKQTYPNLKIIAITGGGINYYRDYLESASLFGADDVLQKPFPDEELLRSVKDCLSMR